MLISHLQLDLSPLEENCFKLPKEPSDQTTRYICKTTHNLTHEVLEEFLHPDDYTAPDEDHTGYLVDYFRRLQYDLPDYTVLEGTHSVVNNLVAAGLSFRDILFNTNNDITLIRLRFVKVTDHGVHSITLMVSLDKTDYRLIWDQNHPGWVDVTYGSPVSVRSVTLYDQEGTKLSSVRINDLENITLSRNEMSCSEAYETRLGVTRLVDEQHELDGTAHVVRNHGFIGDRAVEIVRMDLVRFPRFQW